MYFPETITEMRFYGIHKRQNHMVAIIRFSRQKRNLTHRNTFPFACAVSAKIRMGTSDIIKNSRAAYHDRSLLPGRLYFMGTRYMLYAPAYLFIILFPANPYIFQAVPLYENSVRPAQPLPGCSQTAL